MSGIITDFLSLIIKYSRYNNISTNKNKEMEIILKVLNFQKFSVEEQTSLKIKNNKFTFYLKISFNSLRKNHFSLLYRYIQKVNNLKSINDWTR